MVVGRHIDIIAITDHNSTRAVELALKYAKNKTIEVILGIEIDCTFKDINLHVLGYNIDYKNLWFHELESNILNQERQASSKKIEKIIQCTGLKLDKSEVLRRVHNGVVTGGLIAEILLEGEANRKSTILSPYVEEGNRSDMPYVNFYWDYFSKGKPAYVPIKFISLKETLNIIHNNGEVAVIAHPGNNLKSDLRIIDEIISEGMME